MMKTNSMNFYKQAFGYPDWLDFFLIDHPALTIFALACFAIWFTNFKHNIKEKGIRLEPGQANLLFLGFVVVCLIVMVL